MKSNAIRESPDVKYIKHIPDAVIILTGENKWIQKPFQNADRPLSDSWYFIMNKF